MLTKEEFSSRLKDTMDKQHVKQTDLAKSVGISAANISNYVLGKAFPPIDTLAEIAKQLDVSLDWLCRIEKPLQNQEHAKTLGEVAISIMRILDSLSLECDLETFQIKEEQQVGVRENVDGYGVFPIYEEVEISVPAIAFKSGEIRTFIEDLIKMRKLLKEKTFDYRFYDRWLSDRIQALNELPTLAYSSEDFPF